MSVSVAFEGGKQEGAALPMSVCVHVGCGRRSDAGPMGGMGGAKCIRYLIGCAGGRAPSFFCSEREDRERKKRVCVFFAPFFRALALFLLSEQLGTRARLFMGVVACLLCFELCLCSFCPFLALGFFCFALLVSLGCGA